MGVTGHRADVFGPGALDELAPRPRGQFELIEEAGAELLDRERDCFADAPLRLRFVSPITADLRTIQYWKKRRRGKPAAQAISTEDIVAEREKAAAL